MTETSYRPAPSGFSPEQWATFNRDGFIVIEDALSEDEVQTYLEAIDRVCAADAKYVPGHHFGPQNIVERDPILADLIDHPRHIGYAYDIYGELLKLHQSQIFLRPPDETKNNRWHPDGARALPYGVFSPQLPLQIKLGYWLTDLPRQKMGNLVVLPGSHRQQYFAGYDTHDSMPGEKILYPRPGTITLMHSSIWHRVEANQSEITRKNIFLAYCPAWLVSADRFHSDPAWLNTLNREQRIIMRSYDWAYHNAKPPESDFPLFLDRETGLDRDPDTYDDHVNLARRKRKTMAEKLNERLPATD